MPDPSSGAGPRHSHLPDLALLDTHAESARVRVTHLAPAAVNDVNGAAYCGVGRTTFRTLPIPSRVVGRRRLWLVADIDEWLAALPVAPMGTDGGEET